MNFLDNLLNLIQLQITDNFFEANLKIYDDHLAFPKLILFQIQELIIIMNSERLRLCFSKVKNFQFGSRKTLQQVGLKEYLQNKVYQPYLHLHSIHFQRFSASLPDLDLAKGNSGCTWEPVTFLQLHYLIFFAPCSAQPPRTISI